MGYGYIRVCGECLRDFDLSKTRDREEWFYGHDCEAA